MSVRRILEDRQGSTHLLEPTMSSTTLLLEISFERNCCGADRFLPSLLPRWLYDTIAVGLMPADTRKSVSTDFILVWPAQVNVHVDLW
jgi:hypothetical protein